MFNLNITLINLKVSDMLMLIVNNNYNNIKIIINFTMVSKC